MKLKFNIAARLLITTILILFQIALFASVLLRVVNWSPIVSLFFNLLNIICLLALIWKNEPSAYKVVWILIVVFLPAAGGILYLIFGSKRPAKKLRKSLDVQHQLAKGFLPKNADINSKIEVLDDRALGITKYIENTTSYPAYGGTFSQYFAFGEEMYTEMLKELNQGQHFIFMEYFIIQDGKMWRGILNILSKKAAEGVDVRILYDDAGSIALLPPDFALQMKALGIKCVPFNKVVPFLALRMNSRDHRKIMVIDGHTAFNGGVNIADEYINEKKLFGLWKDTGVMLKGEAVWSFTLMFLETWNAVSNEKIGQDLLDNYRPCVYGKAFDTDGFIQPYPYSPLDENAVGENVYISILNQAKKHVYIMTPYLIIGEQMKAALALAAKRGVDVRIITPGVPDKKIVYMQTRSHYKELLLAGVKIYEFAPGFVHAKSFVSDNRVGVVGTINLDYRSLYLHFECGTLLMGTKTVEILTQDFEDALKDSRAISVTDCARGFLGTLFDAIIRIFAPLL